MELDAALTTHARHVAHAAGNLCLIAELQAGSKDEQGGAALREGLRVLRARAAMIARAHPGSHSSSPTMTWDTLADAFRLVTAMDLAEKRVDLDVDPKTLAVAWPEARPVAFFVFDLLAHAMAAAGATKLWIKAVKEADILTLTLGGGAPLPPAIMTAMQRAVSAYGATSPAPAGSGVFSMQIQL